jgi:carboxyl-terminal processing protease
VSTQLKGVTPDIILPSVVDAIEVGEASLENPLLCDTNEAAKFTPMNVVTPFLKELQQRSAARIAASKDFAYIQEDYEAMRKSRAEKTISLNLAERLKRC